MSCLIETLVVFDELRNALGQLVGGNLEQGRQLIDDVAAFLQVGGQARAGQGRDPADARRDALFLENLEAADDAEAVNVRAAAELPAERLVDVVLVGGAEANDADLAAVLLAKEGHRAELLRLLPGQDGPRDGQIRRDFLADQPLGLFELLLASGPSDR